MCVCTMCCICAIAMNTPVKSYSKIFAGISYYGKVNHKQGAVIAAADGVCQACVYYALLGTGATGGASLVIGLGITA